MTRKLKTLGLALFAVFALTAMPTSAASAAEYTSSSYPTTATGESPSGNTVFTTEGGTTECKTHYEATLNAASPHLAVNATVSNCKAFGFVEATVTGCAFTLTEPVGSGDTYSANIDITNPCTIKAGTCELTVPNQGPLSSFAITNNTAAGDVSVKANVTGINYTVVNDGFLCPFNGTGAKTGATYRHEEAVTFDAVSPASATISVS